jgi:hypothetical protein
MSVIHVGVSRLGAPAHYFGEEKWARQTCKAETKIPPPVCTGLSALVNFLQCFGDAQTSTNASQPNGREIKNYDAERPEGLSQKASPSLCNEGRLSGAW